MISYDLNLGQNKWDFLEIKEKLTVKEFAQYLFELAESQLEAPDKNDFKFLCSVDPWTL